MLKFNSNKPFIIFVALVTAILLSGCTKNINVSDSRIKDVEYNDKWVTVNLAEGIFPTEFYNKNLIPDGAITDMPVEKAMKLFGPISNHYKSDNGSSDVYEIKIPSGIIRITNYLDLDSGGTGNAVDYLPDDLSINTMFEPIVSKLIDSSRSETILILQGTKREIMDIFVIHGSKVAEIL